MRPAHHALTGAALGGSWCIAGADGALALTVAMTHVLLDLDHALDHLFQSPRPFCVRTFLGADNSLTWKRMVFFLHGYEWALLLWGWWWIAPHPALFAAAVGVSTHLLLDEFGNRLDWAPVNLSPGFYFLTWRIARRFLRSRLTHTRRGRTICRGAGPEGAET